MKIVFLSNYYTHHQAPFCEAMYMRLGNDFCFIQTSEMTESRLNLGWGMDSIPSLVKKNYGSPLAAAECKSLIENADVVIIGSAPTHLITNYLKTGKLVLRYSERLLKKRLELWKIPLRYIKLHANNPQNANIHLLCASAFAASDYQKFGLFKNRSYKWGYFPECKRYPDVDALIDQKQPSSILWVAQFIHPKHPEIPVFIAKRLKEEGYSFEMRLIGSGKLEEKTKNMIRKFGLEDCVHILGAMKPNQVREHMEKSQIFLFTSDRYEGWGAVLNESMNSACGVIASNAIGSAPYLLDHEENGLLYQDGNFEDLYGKVKQLLDDPAKAHTLGQQAYETITSLWNAESAADRLLDLIQDLQEHGLSQRYSSGPCSKA